MTLSTKITPELFAALISTIKSDVDAGNQLAHNIYDDRLGYLRVGPDRTILYFNDAEGNEVSLEATSQE